MNQIKFIEFSSSFFLFSFPLLFLNQLREEKLNKYINQNSDTV